MLPNRASMFVISALLVANGCGQPKTTSKDTGSIQSAERRILPSGKSIVVMGVRSVPSGPALSLSYQTSHRMSEIDELEREVDDVWTTFQREAEQADVRMAIIQANNMQRREGRGFVYRRDADGRWRKSSGFLSPTAMPSP